MEGQVPCVGGWSPYLRYQLMSIRILKTQSNVLHYICLYLEIKVDINN